MKILVSAGGQGTKLWPYSRKSQPKQFQKVVGDTTPYQDNIQALLKAFPAEDIFISTKHKFIRYIAEQSPEIPLRNYIIEPDLALDRGPGEGLAFMRLSMLHPDEPFFNVQADVLRLPEDKFIKMIKDAETLVKEHKQYITGGIKATAPSLVNDYLLLGDRVNTVKSQNAYTIDKFLFRGNTLKETKDLIDKFLVVAHCNHACWYPDLMMDAYKEYRPDWHEALMKIRDCYGKPGEDGEIAKIYATMEKGSTEEVTRHVMDSGNAMCIILPFRWIDFGSWDSVYDFVADPGENYTEGRVVTIDSKGSLVKSNRTDKLIAIAGIDDLVVVDTPDALLIVPKSKMDKIKDIQKHLQENEHHEFL